MNRLRISILGLWLVLMSGGAPSILLGPAWAMAAENGAPLDLNTTPADQLKTLPESTVNEGVSKRMVKKQQMQWTPRGAHVLLQVRTKVLNEELDQTFQRWYPGFRNADDHLKKVA